MEKGDAVLGEILGPLGILKKEKQESFSRICSQSDAKSCEETRLKLKLRKTKSSSWSGTDLPEKCKKCAMHQVEQVLMVAPIFALFSQLCPHLHPWTLDKVRNGFHLKRSSDLVTPSP